MNKWIKIILILTIIFCISLILRNFIKSNYKTEESGNNKSIKEIEEYILNINSYKAKIEVTITSNKNVNFYTLEQEVKFPQTVIQIATSPEDLKGIKFIYKDGILEISNTKYNLAKIYKDYPYISNNVLFLTNFIEKYKNAEKKDIIEKNNKIEMSYESKINKYNHKQKLYINKATLLPENLQVYDINNDCKVDIVYKEIELNI